MKSEVFTLPIQSADGEFLASYSEKGLCRLEFPSNTRRPATRAASAQPSRQIQLWHEVATRALTDALAGQRPKALPPLDLSAGTSFQQRVWHTLRKISEGRTWSYGQVAQAIGKSGAARAVGGACGANPIPVLVPCHRVLAGNNKLGGFSGGLDWKRTLLAREGIHPNE